MTAIKDGAYILAHKSGAICYRDEVVKDFRGEEHTLTGGRCPHKPSSSGFVYTGDGYEYYPGVFDLQWVNQEGE
jgi:hypothetical protein